MAVAHVVCVVLRVMLEFSACGSEWVTGGVVGCFFCCAFVFCFFDWCLSGSGAAGAVFSGLRLYSGV